MSKSVLISINPKWCEQIASGKKTVEVRKTEPKLKAPFKVYIYCTKHPKGLITVNRSNEVCNKKVIGEFVCDKIAMSTPGYKDHVAAYWELLDGSCLTADELMDYGQWKFLYGWHISALLIYDKPKELSEFERPCKCVGEYEGESYCDCLNCDDAGDSDYGVIACDKRLKRPPQSWCYVEDLTGGADRE